MKSYRIYVVARDGRLQLAAAFQARDDEDAAARAQIAAPGGQAAELWEGGRLVGHLAQAGGFSSER